MLIMTISLFKMCSCFNTTRLCVLAVLFSIFTHSVVSICGDKSFRMSPLYMDLKPTEIPTKQMNVSSKMVCSTKCYNDVTCTGFFFNYDGRCSLFRDRFHSLTFVNETGTQAYEVVSGVPTDCYDVMPSAGDTSGVYTIVPRDGGAPVNVSCEMTSPTESWLVIQRRTDGSEDFYRTWNEYRDGFGDLNNEFWLGNTNIHRITSQGYYDLRIDLEDFEGNTRYAVYKNFSLASEQEEFRLRLGEYSGDAGDSLGIESGRRFSANGQRFSTKDRDLDVDPDKSCAQKYKGAWWYKSCHSSNLNGLYLNGTHTSLGNGVNWRHWLGLRYSLKRTVMKIRPMKF